MSEVDDGLMRAWLAARSLSRGLPMPVAEHGGWRVDSGQPDERRRFLFSSPLNGLRVLGAMIDEPLIALKLCRPIAELMTLLPARWQSISDPGTRVMVREEAIIHAQPLPDGFRIERGSTGGVTQVRIIAGETLAASGYSVEREGVFIYDRIRTQQGYQRRGLGRALMAALWQQKRSAASREILTATPMGRALYLQLGWRDYSHYSTAMIPAA